MGSSAGGGASKGVSDRFVMLAPGDGIAGHAHIGAEILPGGAHHLLPDVAQIGLRFRGQRHRARAPYAIGAIGAGARQQLAGIDGDLHAGAQRAHRRVKPMTPLPTTAILRGANDMAFCTCMSAEPQDRHQPLP